MLDGCWIQRIEVVKALFFIRTMASSLTCRSKLYGEQKKPNTENQLDVIFLMNLGHLKIFVFTFMW